MGYPKTHIAAQGEYPQVRGRVSRAREIVGRGMTRKLQELPAAEVGARFLAAFGWEGEDLSTGQPAHEMIADVFRHLNAFIDEKNIVFARRITE